jgi:pyruvate, orthophosphate dikinase
VASWQAGSWGMYEERKLVPANPFMTIDKAGVGRLMRIAVFCHELGLDYVSCSPFRGPVARLAAGQAVLGQSRSSST